MINFSVLINIVPTALIFCAFVSLMLNKTSSYRVSVVFASVAIFVNIFANYGVWAALILFFVFGFLLPIALLMIAKLILFLSWNSVRKKFPNEPIQPPVKELTLRDVYRLMWGF